MPVLRILPLVVVLVIVAGCASGTSKGPKTYPARGRVVYPDGQPFPGGLVEFRPTAQGLNAFSTIDKDGSFTLQTLGERDPLPGAPEGRYQVTVTPHAAQDQTKGGVPEPITLRDTVTVKPDDSNEFTLQVPRPKRR